MAGTRISVRIDSETQRWLNAEAAATGKNPSQIVRDTLRRQSKKRRKKPTVYDVFLKAGLIGAIRGLPADLSTNKKYFEGFGESRNAGTDRHGAVSRPVKPQGKRHFKIIP